MKLKLITYWITTILVAAMMLMSAGFSLSHSAKAAEGTARLGYPRYFGDLLGVAFALGALTLLAPGMRKLKEWAYAGFVFTFIAAAYSHYMSNERNNVIPPMVALVVLMISYFTRPPARRIKG